MDKIEKKKKHTHTHTEFIGNECIQRQSI